MGRHFGPRKHRRWMRSWRAGELAHICESFILSATLRAEIAAHGIYAIFIGRPICDFDSEAKRKIVGCCRGGVLRGMNRNEIFLQPNWR